MCERSRSEPPVPDKAAIRVAMVGAGKGNNRGILSTIAKLKEDKDPLIAAAAKAADSYTKEDVRKMN